MNVTLTPIELLHVYKTLLNNPLGDKTQNEILIDKFQRPIVISLEREHDRINGSMFKSWEDKEQKRIEALQASLEDVKKKKVD